ncbi:hypothetical protein HK098_007083 [Nowakowskiella sp. JEL0407]|nr:hypothetical protein HK098_007083 [Nowakowskiella sp. JEL0407]
MVAIALPTSLPTLPDLPNVPLPDLVDIKNFAMRVLLDVVVGAFAPPLVVLGTLTCAGFTVAGVAAGSLAAFFQVPVTIADGFFAKCQRYGAAPLTLFHPYILIAGGVTGLVLDFSGLSSMVLQFSWCVGSAGLYICLWVTFVGLAPVVVLFPLFACILPSKSGYESMDRPSFAIGIGKVLAIGLGYWGACTVAKDVILYFIPTLGENCTLCFWCKD